MARERMVTRTICTSVISAKVYNSNVDNLETVTFTLTGFDTEQEAINQARRECTRQGLTFLKLLKVDTDKQLYGMKEVDFLKYAVPMNYGDTKVPEK